MSDSLQRHGLHHARPPCLSPTPGAYSNACPASQWCHPTMLSSVISFPSCLHSFPALGSFSGSLLFPSGGQNIGASASASVFPVNIQGWFPLGLTDFISLLSRTQESSLAPQFKEIDSLAPSLLYGPTLTFLHDFWKNHSFDYLDLSRQNDVSSFSWAI